MVQYHFLEKRVFDPFLTRFASQKGPFSRHFGIFGGLKRATGGSKQAKTTCFGIPRGLGATLVTAIFLPRVDPMDPFWHPPVWVATCRLPQHNGLCYRGLGARLRDFEGWKRQKVGGCGWTRCPQDRVLSHVAQDMPRSWFRAGCGQFAQILGLFVAFWGHFSDISWSYRAPKGSWTRGSQPARGV